MTTLYTSNFDALTAGQIAPGWTAKVGTWAVGETSPVSGTQSFGSTSNADGDFALYTGVAARADMKVNLSCKLTSLPSEGNNNYYVALRMDSGYTAGYLVACETTENRLRLYKRNGAGFIVASGDTAFAFGSWASGDTLMIEASVVGTTIEARAWKSTESRPASPSATWNDASYASGYAGLYRAGMSKPAAAVDDFTLDDTVAGGAATVPSAPTIGTALAGDGYVDVAYALNGDGGSAILDVTATLSTGETATGTSSPIRVTTSNGTARTATVTARNTVGSSSSSAPSNSVTPTAAAPVGVTVPVTNDNVFFSPYNWYSDGAGAMQANNVKGASTFAWSAMRGAYLKFKATVGAAGSIALNISTATLSAIAAAGCPQIAWSINNGAIQSQTLATGATTLSLATGLAAGTYDVFVYFRGVYVTQDGGAAQNYNAPNNRFHITGIALSAGGTLSAPAIRPKRMIAYGDSITEGDLSNGGPRSATSQDASLTYGWLLAAALDAEIGIIAFYGQQWSWLNSTWSNHASGVSRLVGGLLSPAPDYVTINYGENDGDPGPAASTVTSTLAAVSAAAPSAKIVNIIPFSGRARTNLAAATLPSNGYRIDLAAPQMANGALVWSYDGQHPNQRGNAELAAQLSNRMQSIVPATATRTVTVTLKDANGPCANLSGLKVAFHDEASPDLMSAPRFKTASETTDASGVLTFAVQSTLDPGGTGHLTVLGASGVHYNGSVAVA